MLTHDFIQALPPILGISVDCRGGVNHLTLYDRDGTWSVDVFSHRDEPPRAYYTGPSGEGDLISKAEMELFFHKVPADTNMHDNLRAWLTLQSPATRSVGYGGKISNKLLNVRGMTRLTGRS